MNRKLIAPLSIFSVALVLLVAGVGIFVAHANPSFFMPIQSTAAATSTVSQIIPGTATTTLVFDSMLNGRPYAADSAVLLLQVTASSTSSVVNVAYQYSYNGADWYSDNLFMATTTATMSATTVNSYTWTLASTATTSKALSAPVPVRYTRAVISASGANSFIWAAFAPKQEAL